MVKILDRIICAHATWVLVALNIVAYVGCVLYPGDVAAASLLYGDVTFSMTEPWRMLTYMFVHISPMHLVVNTLFLIILGSWLEYKVRWKRLLAVYLTGGVAGAVFYLIAAAFRSFDQMVLMGCSAAVFALAGAAIIINNGFAFKIGENHLSLNAKTVAIIVLFVMISGIFGRNSVGEFAHIGGFVAGMSLMLVSRKRHLNINPVVVKARQSGFASLSKEERVMLYSHKTRENE